MARYNGDSRLSLRRMKVSNEVYEVYTFCYTDKTDHVIHSGSLKQCVGYTNVITDFEDVVEE